MFMLRCMRQILNQHTWTGPELGEFNSVGLEQKFAVARRCNSHCRNFRPIKDLGFCSPSLQYSANISQIKKG